MFFVVLYYFELGGDGLYFGLGNTDVVDVYIHPEPNKGTACGRGPCGISSGLSLVRNVEALHSPGFWSGKSQRCVKK